MRAKKIKSLVIVGSNERLKMVSWPYNWSFPSRPAKKTINDMLRAEGWPVISNGQRWKQLAAHYEDGSWRAFLSDRIRVL